MFYYFTVYCSTCFECKYIHLQELAAYCGYRASVPVQYSYTSTPRIGRTACTEPQCLYSTAIPLLPLWAVRPVQSLSACTLQLYLYSPYRPYSLYRASVPLIGCTLPFLPYLNFIAITKPEMILSNPTYVFLNLVLFFPSSFCKQFLKIAISHYQFHVCQNRNSAPCG